MKIDVWTGYQASDVCKGPSQEEVVLNVTDKWAREWFDTNAGRDWLENHDLPRKPYYAPDRECSANDPQPIIEIDLDDGQAITSATLDIKGSATAESGFKKWVLEYGQGADPGSWSPLTEINSPVKNGALFSWNLSNVPNGPVTLRLTLIGDKAEVEKRVTLNLSLPTPTPPPVTQTDTPAPTLTPTEAPTQAVIIPTATSIPPTETPTGVPASTP
jgi:hypothetical protein